MMDTALIRRRPGRNNARSPFGGDVYPLEAGGRIIAFPNNITGAFFATAGGRITGSIALMGERGRLDSSGRLARTE